MRTAKILGVTGTPRSKDHGQGIKRIVSEIKDESMLNAVIEKLARDQALSNSEICLSAALFGVKKAGLDFEIVNLRDYVEGTSIKNAEALEGIVKSSQGIILASPVYFGDRSYLIDTFMAFLNKKSLFDGRAVGAVSVGAKRNGGQETTNIYILKEAADAGAYVVGNGPPTSQYGGTAWAGNIGTIRDDELGIITSMGTGKRVARVASLLNAKGDLPADTLKVACWIMRDHDNTLLHEIEKINEYANNELGFDLQVDVINFLDMDFRSCMACPICPFNKDETGLYKCRIRKDDFEKQYERLVSTDAILICGYNPSDITDLRDIYQKTLERTRCIRRDNFLLTDVPVTSLSVEELPGRSLFHIKAMTSFLRHNSVIHPSLTSYVQEGERIIGAEEGYLDFLNFAAKIKKARRSVEQDNPPVYVPIGYTTEG